MNRTLARGVFLVAISLFFGLSSLQYQVGAFSHAGPALFPLMVSGLLLLIGVATVIQARFAAGERVEFNVRNVALVLTSLTGFVLLSQFMNMTAGIVFMVFCSTFAGTSYSVVRNLKISIGLLVIAFVMSKGLGVNLPLL